MSDEYYEITYKELRAIARNRNYVLLDIRPYYEYRKGHIRGAVSYPEHELLMDLNHLDRRNIYVLICQKGKNSRELAIIMSQNGYRTLNLINGMDGIDN